jgi:hypothetical protein
VWGGGHLLRVKDLPGLGRRGEGGRKQGCLMLFGQLFPRLAFDLNLDWAECRENRETFSG